ncbi:10542_t:CDS:2, partial [Acaulospora colombiana]
LPLYRDLLMALGICSVSKKSCNYILQKGKGNAICIVIGGAAESLMTKVEQPSMEKVLEVHALYIEELKRSAPSNELLHPVILTNPHFRIWEKYKDQYARQRTKDLRII